MFFMGLIPVLVIGLIVWLLVDATRRHDEPTHPAASALYPGYAGPTSSARAVLDERYARGEIDREEYLQRRQDLER